ncbi:MAG: helix-turn-helix transcriptional regulator [Proteobacteria bacterium]|nr:helix-turn-helix transcriptional regulator [Pseudomonadota bacterium]
MDTFAANLRTRIAELGLTQAEAARRCDLENRRFHHYLVGDREPDLSTLMRIAEMLGTTPDALLGIKATAPVDSDEASRHRAKLSAALVGMDLAALRLLTMLVDGVIAFTRDGGASAARRLQHTGPRAKRRTK